MTTDGVQPFELILVDLPLASVGGRGGAGPGADLPMVDAELLRRRGRRLLQVRTTLK